VGSESKIMKNAKKAPRKISNLMLLMNKMLYTVFAAQLLIITILAGFSLMWTGNNSSKALYLNLGTSQGAAAFFVNLLTYWVAYSHMIPISLYVIIELLKLGQAYLINHDVRMYCREDSKFALCRNSDLIEELGQVEFVFSDKTGTLT
jgi:phospholipid-transporting ATPase